MMIIVSSWLDKLGIAMGLWHYHWEVIPFMPANFPWNFSLLPVTVMFLHQYKSGIHTFIKALIFGGFSAFLAETISQMADLYHPVYWKHTYSFPIYVGLYLLTRASPSGAFIAQIHPR
jgi:xanthine/uracil permease